MTTPSTTKMKLKVKGDASPEQAPAVDNAKLHTEIKAVVNDMLDKGEFVFETPAEGIVQDVKDNIDDLIPLIWEKLQAYGKTHGK